MSSPLVSVVIPTHNRPKMLAEAIASVRAQTFTNYEIIVVSNCESEEVRRASHEAATAYDCHYFALLEGNLAAARNFGIERAKGEWIAFLDDDDLWLPNKLERQLAEAQRTGADMVSCSAKRVIPDGWSFVKAASHELPWAIPSEIMVRKHVIDEAGGFDPRLRYCEDIDLWRRISWFHSIYHTDEVLAEIRTSHPRMSTNYRTLYSYSLRHLAKMYRDTPRHLRWALPSAATFGLFRLALILSPYWLIRLHPRQRWLAFRRRLQTRLARRVV